MYDVHLKAFDDVDTKANWVVGYTTVSGALVALLTARSGTVGPPLVPLGASVLCFVTAILIVLWSMRPVDIGGPPSAKLAFDYWSEKSDEETVAKIIVGTEKAWRRIHEETNKKADRVLWAQHFVAAAFVLLVIGIAWLLALGMLHQLPAQVNTDARTQEPEMAEGWADPMTTGRVESASRAADLPTSAAGPLAGPDSALARMCPSQRSVAGVEHRPMTGRDRTTGTEGAVCWPGAG